MKTAFVCLSLTLPGALLAQNVLNMTGNPTATAIVACSVRQLSSAYTGKCMLVRRSSDGDSMNIGFTSAGDLDTATLLSFVGSSSGYVRTWYDQSGYGLNAVQYTNAAQPTIVVNGVINRDNGQPSVYTNGTTGFLYYQPVTQLNGTTTVVPNPFGSNMEITCTVPNNGPVEVQIQDMTGATIMRREYTATRGNNTFSLTNCNNLAKGTYVVLVVQEGIVGIGKVMKE